MPDSAIVASEAVQIAIPINAVKGEALDASLNALDERERRLVAAVDFKGEAGRHLLVPDANGGIGRVLFGLGGADAVERNPLLFGRLGPALPAGIYRFSSDVEEPELAALAFALSLYRFDRYRKPKESVVRLAVPEGVDLGRINTIRDGVVLARDLINTPANDLSPRDLAAAAEKLAERHGARIDVIEGETLERGFPMIHAVGAASERAPCLVDMRWGSENHPKVTLIGKGIVFDTGGLDIKPSAAMLLMKKDMGGAANVLGLASMIMDAGLKLRLRVLIPGAENAVSGRAFRPGDILKSRKGMTVEVGNTDAEGRLVLADALALADEESPRLVVTIATLTGAARVALGPELPPFFTDDDDFANEIEAAAAEVYDPVWRLPLWPPLR